MNFSSWSISTSPLSNLLAHRAMSESTKYLAANVKVGFYSGNRDDDELFDRVLGILAHAFLPESDSLQLDVVERSATNFGNEGLQVAGPISGWASAMSEQVGKRRGWRNRLKRQVYKN